MSVKRKINTLKSAKKRLPPEIAAIKAFLSTKKNLFPEMTKKVQEMLDRSDFNPS
jgi:hypothetical protein